MSVVDERVAELEEMLADVQSKLASFQAQTQPHRAAINKIDQQAQNDRIIATSRKELDRFNDLAESSYESLKAVVAGSTTEFQIGYVKTPEEVLHEVRRLGIQLGDALMAADRKQYQHKQLVARLGTLIPKEPSVLEETD